ncbi:MAG TPA: hypothetical protein VMY34_00065, partial [Acidimicrobiales bacterium]|nr:hypothetical protein [Acidimicrobiales bacterium]
MSEGTQLGALLKARGLLSEEALAAALQEQTRTRQQLGRILIDKGLVTEADLVATLAAQLGLEFVDLADSVVDPSASSLVS